MNDVTLPHVPMEHTERNVAVPWRWIGLRLLLLVAGGSLGWLARTVSNQPSDSEVTFTRDMAAHHAQAIEMALIIRDRSTDDELRTLALDIMLTQQAQIGQMQGWLSVWNQPLIGTEPPMNGMGEMMGLATEEQIAALRTLPIDQAEIAFLQLLIRHHQGAVLMSQEALREATQPEVVDLASKTIAAQQSEIEYMQQLLAKRGAHPLAPVQPMEMQHTQ